MTGYSSKAPDPVTLTDDVVRALAEAVGLHLAPQRLPEVAAQLRNIVSLAADLDALDLVDSAPETNFDPSWDQPA